MTNTTYWADDGNCAVEMTGCETAKEAAQTYVDDGDWGEETKTRWINIAVWTEDDEGEESENIKITIEPDEPPCEDGEDHNWTDINDSVRSDGGGVRWSEECTHCGAIKNSGSWGQDPETGEPGLDWIEYES